jgi:hypothetical protein
MSYLWFMVVAHACSMLNYNEMRPGNENTDKEEQVKEKKRSLKAFFLLFYFILFLDDDW